MVDFTNGSLNFTGITPGLQNTGWSTTIGSAVISSDLGGNYNGFLEELRGMDFSSVHGSPFENYNTGNGPLRSVVIEPMRVTSGSSLMFNLSEP